MRTAANAAACATLQYLVRTFNKDGLDKFFAECRRLRDVFGWMPQLLRGQLLCGSPEFDEKDTDVQGSAALLAGGSLPAVLGSSADQWAALRVTQREDWVLRAIALERWGTEELAVVLRLFLAIFIGNEHEASKVSKEEVSSIITTLCCQSKFREHVITHCPPLGEQHYRFLANLLQRRICLVVQSDTGTFGCTCYGEMLPGSSIILFSYHNAEHDLVNSLLTVRSGHDLPPPVAEKKEKKKQWPLWLERRRNGTVEKVHIKTAIKLFSEGREYISRDRGRRHISRNVIGPGQPLLDDDYI